LPSREVLEEALQEFDGTLLFVSHDRAFIDRLATHTLELKDGRAVVYHGNYTDVLYRQQEMKRQAEEALRQHRRDELDEERREKARSKRRRQTKSTDEMDSEPTPDQLMDEIELLEAQILSLEEELSQREVYMNYKKAGKLNSVIREKKACRDELFKKLEDMMEG
jgi:ATP-binding cassette subfamily F protein 3